MVIDCVGYLPWLKILLKQTHSVSKDYWTPSIDLKYIIHIFLSLISPDYNKKIFFVFSLFVILIMIYIIVKTLNMDSIYDYIGLLMPIILVLIGVVLSKLVGHTVLVLRYLTPVMGIFWLSMASLISEFLSNHDIPNMNRYVVLGLIVLLSIGSYSSNLYQVHKYESQFSQTLQVYSKVPANSRIIYDNSVVMYSASSYLHHNYSLGDRNNDVLFKIYNKVFDNIKSKNNYKLNKNSKLLYFVKAGKQAKSGLKQYDSKMGNRFYSKYKDKMKKIGNIYLPLDGGESSLYKIKS